MMKLDQQRMVLFAKSQELQPYRRLPFDVERLSQQLHCLQLNRCGSVALRQLSEVETFQARPNRRHRLRRFAQTFEENRSQRFVALADRGDARLQDVKVEWPGKMRCIHHVVLVSDLVDRAQEIDSLLLP